MRRETKIVVFTHSVRVVEMVLRYFKHVVNDRKALFYGIIRTHLSGKEHLCDILRTLLVDVKQVPMTFYAHYRVVRVCDSFVYS